MKRQVWELTDGGVRHRVEVTGDVNRTVRWHVDDELAVEKKSMEDKLTVTRDGGQALTVRYSALGSPRRASLYDDQATSLIGVGGVDLVPEEGSRAAAWEQRIIDHPRRHTLIATLGGVATVVVPIVAVALLLPPPPAPPLRHTSRSPGRPGRMTLARLGGVRPRRTPAPGGPPG